jgi:hypothetical protein
MEQHPASVHRAHYGFVLVLGPPLMLALTATSLPFATFVAFIVASPITRALLGTWPKGDVLVEESMAAFLTHLPTVYGATLTASLIWLFAQIAALPALSLWHSVALGLSLWTVLVFGTFPAHELMHRRDRLSLFLGSALAGICGYPPLGLEHSTHHAREASAENSEAPARSEGVWTFALRRLPVACQNASTVDQELRRSGVSFLGLSPLRVAIVASLLTAVLAFLLGGSTALAIYSAAVASVVLSMQIMVYVQHWALGTNDGARSSGLAWEDDCRVQAWLTLGNAFHLAHHRAPNTPFFFLSPSEDSPRQPGCYVVMLSCCVIPSLWRRLMFPVIDAFNAEEARVCKPGRRAACFVPTPNR